MSHEYHGWMVLAASQEDWSSKEFDDAFRRVRDLVEELNLEMGHDASMPAPNTFPQMVYFKGSDTEAIQPVFQTVHEIIRIFAKTYGEVVFFDDRDDRNRWWDFSAVIRYRVEDGRATEEHLRSTP